MGISGAASFANKSIKDLVDKAFKWVMERLERTIFLGLKFTLPAKVISPLGFLGMMTFTAFVVLGISGALLMLYYQPTFEGAYDSVQKINDQIPFGFQLRNVHYHASNAMVLLALLHMFYQYFKGRYKLRYEVLWVTGIILGVLTIIEAYTGYDIILNVRAMLAINIGRALAYNTPVMGFIAGRAFTGEGVGDLVLRLYSLHVFILPMILLLIMVVHFPRYLVFDLPVLAAINGIILVIGGLFPVELGVKFVATNPTSITFPEWYLTGIYAFIRTGIPAFIAGALIPVILIIFLLVVPFLDRGKKLSIKDRPFFAAMGVMFLGQILVTTIWGFRANDFFHPLDTVSQLELDPLVFFGSMIMIGAISYGGVYAWTAMKKGQAPVRKATVTKTTAADPFLARKEAVIAIIALFGFQAFLNISGLLAFAADFQNLVLIEIGAILLAFAGIVHTYRYAQAKK